jgi:tetratricopeptide (TPR) repeat protein/anti-sigma regulatory factor (Ser/Thr protein kinase)
MVFQGLSQEQDELISREFYYSDFVADENGRRMAGITVRIVGKNISTKTNGNGEFTIEADLGDMIELSRNGKVITTYRYDGSPQYELEDNSGFVLSDSNSKRADLFNIHLDSARQFVAISADKSILQIEMALKTINSKRGNASKLAVAYDVLGDVYIRVKQYDLAASNYSISLTNKKSDLVSLKLAKAYALNNEIGKSSSIFSDLLSRKIPLDSKVDVFEGLGDNLKKQMQYDNALANYKNALTLASENEINSRIPVLNSKIGAIYALQGNSSAAEDYFDNSIESVRKDSLNKRVFITNSVANQYRDQQNFDREIELKKGNLRILEEAEISEISGEVGDDKITVQQLNLDIGNAYAKKRSYDKALNYLEKSKEDAEKVSDVETKKEAVKQLSEVYNSVGDFPKALNSYQEYVGLVDILYQKKEQEIKAAIELSKDLAEKQHRINSLEKDRNLLESSYLLSEAEQKITIENYKRQRTIIYSLIGGLLLLILTLYFMYKSNMQRKVSNNLLALKSLRSQMNPHFIFNALNSVNSFIAKNDERSANRYLSDFSTLMRSVLDNSEKDFLPLSEEIELLELYIKLEHSRFKDKFDYEIEIDKFIDIDAYKIPPMLLQPYVENAVWHGLRYKKNKGILKVLISEKNDQHIEIEISDNGIGRRKSKELKTEHQKNQESKGMANIRKRIAILNAMYSDKINVKIEDINEDNSGTKVKLTLKKD